MGKNLLFHMNLAGILQKQSHPIPLILEKVNYNA